MMPEERYIELDVTYRCRAKCRHCCFSCSPTKEGVMSVEDARTFMAEARELGLNGRKITITGGEALLYYETVLGIVQAAADLGLTPLHAIQSNASWCTTDELTRERLTALRDAGLAGMFFSADVYHREFIPAERTRRGVRIADEVFGPENVAVSREFLARDEVPTVDEHLPSIRKGPPIMVGRAPWELAEHLDTVPLEEILARNCTGGHIDLDPRSVYQINVDPWGWVSSWICSGIALGNALETPLSEILTWPLEEHHPVVQEVIARGPGAMLEMAAEHGFQPKERYVSKCHLCWDLRAAIHAHYPDLFVPALLYCD